MILVFGGAYQGKLDYALERFNLTDGDVYICRDDDIDMPQGKKIIYELDKWLLALVRAGIDADQALRQFIRDNADAVVICNDISCGIVPIDAALRKWREAAGRSLVTLSHTSDEVIRLFCGIPEKVK